MILTLTALTYVSYSEQANFKALGTHKCKNIMGLALSIFTVVFLTLVHNYFEEPGTLITLINNPLFWIVIMLDTPVAFIKRKNYEYNHNSITAISGAMQLSFIFLPFAAWLISDILGYKSNNTSMFSSTHDLFLYSIVITLALGIYLRDKIHLKEVNSLFFLLLTPAWMSLSLYAFVILIQSGAFIAPFIIGSVINSFIFIVLASKNSEFRQLDKEVTKDS